MYKISDLFISDASGINLYNDLKSKKYMGIINVYTSIIFDYKFLEIILKDLFWQQYIVQ